MATKVVAVVGASGSLGAEIVRALVKKGVHVRAMVRQTSDRSTLESLGVREFFIADLMDAASLQHAMAVEPKADAVIASASGFSAHTARTKGDNSRTDTDGYRNLVNAVKEAGIPRFVLISILNCDKAVGVPHFSQKWQAEKYLIEKDQPYIALRAGAFLDRAKDVVASKIQKGLFPDIIPGVALDMIYSVDLARYSAEAAIDLPVTVLNQSVDICCDVPVTGPMVAAAFTRVLGRQVVAKAVFPLFFVGILPLIARFFSAYLRDQIAVLAWIRKGGYVSHERQKQLDIFGDLPTIEESVARYCRDKGLMKQSF